MGKFICSFCSKCSNEKLRCGQCILNRFYLMSWVQPYLPIKPPRNLCQEGIWIKKNHLCNPIWHFLCSHRDDFIWLKDFYCPGGHRADGGCCWWLIRSLLREQGWTQKRDFHSLSVSLTEQQTTDQFSHFCPTSKWFVEKLNHF